MAYEFSDDLKTGHPLIDKEHRELIEKVNLFFDSCTKGIGTKKVLEMVSFLEVYVEEHFLHEELMQIRVDYPKYRQHKDEHDIFKLEIMKLKNKVAIDGASLGIVVLINQIVGHWLINHIKKDDIEFVRFLDKYSESGFKF